MPNTPEQAIANAAAQSVNGPVYGSGQCLMRVRLAYGVTTTIPNAAASWAASTHKHPTTDPASIPRGVPIYWTGGSHGYGHVAIATGDGNCWSTDIRRTGYFDLVPITEIHAKWGLTLVGWTDDVNGVVVNTTEDPMAARIDGVDLSHWQSNVSATDLAAAKAAGVRWAYHKATEGTNSTDPAYPARVKLIRSSGLAFGSYHFARPSASSGAAQARYFLSVASIQPGDMRPMLDLEDDGGLSRAALTAWVGDFVAAVIAATGVPPFIYTHFALDKTFDCPLWVARYSDKMLAPVVPAPWKTWSIWQESDGVYGKPNSIPGLGNVDLNTMNGDPAALTKAFQIPGGVPVTPKPVPPPAPTPEETVTPADIKAIAAAVADINIVNKDASGKVEGNGTLAGMISRLDIANNQAADKLDALTKAVTELNATLQAAISAGK